MLNSGSLSVLLCAVLVVVAMSGSEAKTGLKNCCTKVTNKEIKEPILGYLVQRANPPCVNAVIFQTQSGLFCIYARAPWVGAKIVAFEKAKAQPTAASASEVSS